MNPCLLDSQSSMLATKLVYTAKDSLKAGLLQKFCHQAENLTLEIDNHKSKPLGALSTSHLRQAIFDPRKWPV